MSVFKSEQAFIYSRTLGFLRSEQLLLKITSCHFTARWEETRKGHTKAHTLKRTRKCGKCIICRTCHAVQEVFKVSNLLLTQQEMEESCSLLLTLFTLAGWWMTQTCLGPSVKHWINLCWECIGNHFHSIYSKYIWLWLCGYILAGISPCMDFFYRIFFVALNHSKVYWTDNIKWKYFITRKYKIW